MRNTFYSDFDYDFDTDVSRPEGVLARNPKGRTPFEQDRDRIVYSPAFRRLQSKTQVFVAGEYDFYRTRLTHSIEVAQVGRSICSHLNRNAEQLDPVTFALDEVLVEAACLAHDIGHPSFGHAGEAALNSCMAEFGGFEGNAQNLRILTENFYRTPGGRSGMRPTRALLDALLKYKVLFRHSEKKRNHFLYDDQKPLLDFVLDGNDLHALMPVEDDRNSFKSLECQIMDWADDVAYSTSDLLDGIEAGFLTRDGVERWAGSCGDGTEAEFAGQLCAAIHDGEVGKHLNRCIGEFIRAVSLRERASFMSPRTNRHRFALEVDPQSRARCETYKRLAVDLVFRTPQIQQLEYKGSVVIGKLFRAFMDNYAAKRPLTLLPESFGRELAGANEARRARVVCDYISGMTDGFIVRTYRRLFDPSFGSISDLV